MGIHPETTIISKDTCISVFIVALFTVTKTWNYPKYSSTENWIKKIWYSYTMEYYSAIKTHEIMTFAELWMDLGIIIPSEII